MHRTAGLLLVSGLALALGACDPTFVDPGFALATDYYPLETGRSVTYRVDSILYYETITNDTISWDIRETIGTPYTGINGLQTWPVERYRSEPGLSNWELVDVWAVVYENSRLERTEQNLRFIRLISPVAEGSTWQGHVYLGDLSEIPVAEQCNNLSFLEGWTYTYEEVGVPATVGDMNFDETVLVRQTGEQNLIEHNESEERYAKGVGMVYRYFRHFTTQTICPECPWEDNVECGYSVTMTVIDHN